MISEQKILPHKARGEGHYCAVFEKTSGGRRDLPVQKSNISRQTQSLFDDFCLKTFGEQAIAIWKNGERIGYLALCGGNQVVEAEVLEEQDFVPALAAYLKENALDSLFISIPVYETGKAAALSEVCENFTKERCGSAMYRIFEFADVIEAMLTMKAETMGISDGTWSAVLEGQPVTVTVKDGTVTVTRETHPGADVLNREQAQELLLSPLASKGSKVPSEIWKNIPSDWFPLPLYCATADEF